MTNQINHYLFRGKRIDNEGWVEGGYIFNPFFNRAEIHVFENDMQKVFEVDPSTVGLISKVLGQEIAVGDILHCFDSQSTTPDKPFGATEIVEWKDGCLWLRHRDVSIIDFLMRADGDRYEILVVGNIHDTPELITAPTRKGKAVAV
jgi:YopX protein